MFIKLLLYSSLTIIVPVFSIDCQISKLNETVMLVQSSYIISKRNDIILTSFTREDFFIGKYNMSIQILESKRNIYLPVDIKRIINITVIKDPKYFHGEIIPYKVVDCLYDNEKNITEYIFLPEKNITEYNFLPDYYIIKLNYVINDIGLKRIYTKNEEQSPIMGTDRDEIFLHILREEKNINNFLDVLFGFLYRCTDFYVESNSEQKLGFPSGVAEKLVLSSMYKWKNIASTLQKTISSVEDSTLNNSRSVSHSNQLTLTDNENCSLTPSVVQEIEIDSCTESTDVNPPPAESLKIDHVSDSYNGAIRDNYVWTQTLNDLDVLVKIPEHIKTSKDTIKVNISSDEIKIDVKPLNSSVNCEWDNIFNGKLSFRIRKDESVWSIEPGKHINIHLEKATERWWEALIIDEPKIDLSKIDCLKHFDDMMPEEQMKVQKLMWNQQQKLLGKPTSEQIKMEAILKQAWNAKGSPFQGTPYDPTILKYN